MAKRHAFRKTKPGKPILDTARELESFMSEHKGKFSSRECDKFERMELIDSPVRDAIHELKTYSLETLTQRFGVRLLGRGKRVFARLDSEDDTWYHFSLAYIPRALNNRDVNNTTAMIRIKTFWQLVNRWHPLDYNRVLKVIVQETGGGIFS